MDSATQQLNKLANAAGFLVVGDGDAMPVVRIEQDLNITARRLGEIVARLDLFFMNGDQVFFDHVGDMQIMTGRKFRTWIRLHVITAYKFAQDDGGAIAATMKPEEASTILDCEEFRRGVRVIKGVNRVQCPVVRDGGKLEWLPWGYDIETQIYTVPGGLDYQKDLELAVAKGRFERAFRTFPMTDDRSFAVQVAAMLALYIRHLPGGMTLRPGLLWKGNKPGCGKSVLAKACLYPVMGTAAAAKLKKAEDLDKELEAFARAEAAYIFYDNVYGSLSSSAIDQFLTSEETTGRGMGGHGVFTAKNSAMLIMTANQIELNEDAQRRWLVVDLHEQRPVGELQHENLLCDAVMKTREWRVAILEALSAFVSHWHAAGMPKGQELMATFEPFSELLGGIVCAAGYPNPFQKAVGVTSLAPDDEEFVLLLDAIERDMGDLAEKKYPPEALAKLVRANGLFVDKWGTLEDGRRLTIKQDGLGRDERAYAVDEGYTTADHRTKVGRFLTPKNGTQHRTSKGTVFLFGKREEKRKQVVTISRLS